MSALASLIEAIARPGLTEIEQAQIAQANKAGFSVLISESGIDLVEPSSRKTRAWRDYSGEWVTEAGTRCESLGEVIGAIREGL